MKLREIEALKIAEDAILYEHSSMKKLYSNNTHKLMILFLRIIMPDELVTFMFDRNAIVLITKNFLTIYDTCGGCILTSINRHVSGEGVSL